MLKIEQQGSTLTTMCFVGKEFIILYDHTFVMLSFIVKVKKNVLNVLVLAITKMCFDKLMFGSVSSFKKSKSIHSLKRKTYYCISKML